MKLWRLPHLSQEKIEHIWSYGKNRSKDESKKSSKSITSFVFCIWSTKVQDERNFAKNILICLILELEILWEQEHFFIVTFMTNSKNIEAIPPPREHPCTVFIILNSCMLLNISKCLMKIILMMTKQERQIKMETHRHFNRRTIQTVKTRGNSTVKDLRIFDTNL